MKRFVAIAAAFALSLSIVGCANQEPINLDATFEEEGTSLSYASDWTVEQDGNVWQIRSSFGSQITVQPTFTQETAIKVDTAESEKVDAIELFYDGISGGLEGYQETGAHDRLNQQGGMEDTVPISATIDGTQYEGYCVIGMYGRNISSILALVPSSSSEVQKEAVKEAVESVSFNSSEMKLGVVGGTGTQEEKDEQAERMRQYSQNARDDLQAAISRCSGYAPENYTPESYQPLAAALETANAAMLDESLTATEINSAKDALEEAEAGLEEPIVYEAVAYRDVARNPDSYKGSRLTFTGRVLQVQESASGNIMRLATDGEYDDIVLVAYSSTLLGGTRVLEDDNVTVNGMCSGLTTYTTVLGASVSLPGLAAEAITIN